MFLLGICTAGIAFLPGYNSMGFTAIVLLSVLRFGQGIALGGAWDGLASLLALNAPDNKRGWFAMIPQLGAPIGFLIASGLFAYLVSSLGQEDFLSWGWRYPFYVAFAINVVALFARLRLVMTTEFTRLLTERELEPTAHPRDVPLAGLQPVHRCLRRARQLRAVPPGHGVHPVLGVALLRPVGGGVPGGAGVRSRRWPS